MYSVPITVPQRGTLSQFASVIAVATERSRNVSGALSSVQRHDEATSRISVPGTSTKQHAAAAAAAEMP